MARMEGPPLKPTSRRDDVCAAARSLVEDLRDVIRNEEAWYIAQAYLSAAMKEGYEIAMAERARQDLPANSTESGF